MVYLDEELSKLRVASAKALRGDALNLFEMQQEIQRGMKFKGKGRECDQRPWRMGQIVRALLATLRTLSLLRDLERGGPWSDLHCRGTALADTLLRECWGRGRSTEMH